MLGNLSQTVVKVPNFFNLLTKLSGPEFSKTRYREPPLIDTFSQLKRVNSQINKRYFRLNDHFKESAPYKYLNYNNNKRYISPISKLPLRNFQSIFFSEYEFINNSLKKNNSQAQLIPKSKNISINSSNNISKDNTNRTSPNDINNNKINIKIENNRYDLLNPVNPEENKISDINENIINNNIDENKKEEVNNNEINEENKNDENRNNENNLDNNINDNTNNEVNINENNIDDEQKKVDKYMQKLRDKKPNNIEELKEFLDIKFMDETKKTKTILPKIRRFNKSISQDDLFKRTIDKKIESLTVIRPEVKNSIYTRKKNIILKRDYDLLQKIYNNHKNLPFRFNNNLTNKDLLY